eukprot:14357538-Alexandrium_andersonii.AAC.1
MPSLRCAGGRYSARRRPSRTSPGARRQPGTAATRPACWEATGPPRCGPRGSSRRPRCPGTRRRPL